MRTRIVPVVLLAACSTGPAFAQPCVERWDPTFGWRQVNGSAETVIPVVHDGREMLLVLGRIGTSIGVVGAPGPKGAVLWDGVFPINPLPVGYAGPIPDEIWCAAQAPDEIGGGVYAAGPFRSSPGAPTAEGSIGVYRDGAWQILMPIGAAAGTILDMTFYDDGAGGGPALHVGGSFAFINGQSIHSLARWNGAAWENVGSGVNNRVWTLHVVPGENGDTLYAGGDFVQAGGQSALRIAMWDGDAWTPLGSGIGGVVYAIESAQEEGARMIYAGGDFTTAGGAPCTGIARWDGASWSAVGQPVPTAVVKAIGVWPGDGPGAGAYAGRSRLTDTNFVEELVRLEGGEWVPQPGFGRVKDLRVVGHPTTAAPVLAVAGGSGQGNIIRMFDGVHTHSICNGGSPTTFDGVRGFVLHDDGSGVKPYAFGQYTSLGERWSQGLTPWNGVAWEPAEGWIGGAVWAACHITYAGRPSLALVGNRVAPDGLFGGAFAVWDGEQVHAPQGGIHGHNSTARSVVRYDDNGAFCLVIGGNFDTGLVSQARWMASWDGDGWGSMDANLGTDAIPYALAVFHDGSGAGPSLFAAGRRMIGTTTTLVKWNGASWTPVPVPSGGGTIRQMIVGDLGDGERLYIAGEFSVGFPGHVGRWSIFSWDGATWLPVGQPLSYGSFGSTTQVHALHIADVHGVPTLFAGGRFLRSGPVPLRHVGRWSEGRWRPLGRGIDGPASTDPVRGFAVWNDGAETSVFVGGEFDGSTYNQMSDVGRFILCNPSAATTLADVNVDGIVDEQDVIELARAVASGRAGAPSDFDVNGDGAIDASDFAAVLGAIGQQP